MLNARIVPIIGGGPAGMSCALWLCNLELSPIVIERETAVGGMARRSAYPNEGLLGRPGESARESAEAFERHLRSVSVEAWVGTRPIRIERMPDGQFQLELVSSLESCLVSPDAASPAPLSHRSLTAAAVVIATGTRFEGQQWIDTIDNARALEKEGRVHVGAPWAGDPGAELGSHVAIIGGGDNAFDVARMLAEKGVRVSVIMRSQMPKAQPLMVRRLHKAQISGMAQVFPANSVRSLDRNGAKVRLGLSAGEVIVADHVLLLFGYRPNSDEAWMKELALRRDGKGYLIVDGNMETSCRGVFAVGDISNPSHPCIATAVAAGTMAAREIGKRLWSRGKNEEPSSAASDR
jgi:thioredoxin reductase (NADPH)